MNPPPYFTQTEESVSISLLGTVSLRSNLSLFCDVQEGQKVHLILTDAGSEDDLVTLRPHPSGNPSSRPSADRCL